MSALAANIIRPDFGGRRQDSAPVAPTTSPVVSSAESMGDAVYHAWLLDMFRDAEEASETSRDKAARDLDYYDGKQWTDEEVKALKRRGQPAITLNKIRDRVDYYLGLERTQRTKPQALPRTPADEDQAHAATDALRFVADLSKYDKVRSKVWGDIIKVGWGGTETTAVPSSGRKGDPSHKVMIRRCAWDRMFFDPYSAEDEFTDAAYLGMVIWQDRDEAVRKYGEAAAQVFDETIANDITTFDDKPQRAWVQNGSRRRIRIVQIYHINPNDGEWDFCEFTRGGILQSGPSPWLDEEGKRTHPYEWQSCYVDRDNNRYGVIRDLIDPQDEMNKRRSKALHMFTSRQTFGRQGVLGSHSTRELREQLARPDGHVEFAGGVEYGKDFGIIPNGDQVAGHMEMLQQTMAVFETMGPNAAMQGKQSGAPSGRALIASQQGGQIQLGTVMDGLRQLDYDVFRKSWLLIKQFWSGETWVRVTDDMKNLQWVGLNKPKMVTDPVTGQPSIDPRTGQPIPLMNPQTRQPVMDNDVSGLDVDIIIDEAPSNGTLADEQFQMLIQLKQMDSNNEIPFSAIVGAAPNLRGKTEMVQAIQKRENQPPNPLEVAGAQAKIADTSAAADLKKAQTAETMAKVGQTQAETENTHANTRKTVVDTHGSATGSLKTAFDIANILQQPLVSTPDGFTVPAK